VKTFNAFAPQDLKAFEPTEKIGLLATVNPAGLPHVTMITALQAKTPTQLVWGQFTEGLSKHHVKENPRTAFLIMTLDRRLWRGKARYTHARREGEDYVLFNEKPMFRYNSYFGIHTVHYMDLVETTAGEPLPLGRIIPASLLTWLGKHGAGTGEREPILTPWGVSLFGRLDTLKFLSYLGADGFPIHIPLVQCQAAHSRRLVFSPLAYESELAAVPPGATVAVFGLSLQMENLLVRGTFAGYRRRPLVKLGTVELDFVYNSMPPNHGQIYPRTELRPVTQL